MFPLGSKAAVSQFAEPGMDVRFTGCIPDGDRVIVRVRCTVPQGAGVQGTGPQEVELQAVSPEGEPLGVPAYEMGRFLDAGSFPFESAGWRIDFSVPLPAACRGFGVRARCPSGAFPDVVRFLGDGERERLEREFRDLTLNAGADGSYDAWFRAQRADDARLARQRAARFAFEPLISIVVPLYRTAPAHFADMYASVACQTYANWQLVLVNASPDDAVLGAALAGIGDGRVSVVSLEGNRGIVGNTWAGVDAATGDYIAFLDHDDFLEEDALFEYVSALNADECDVLYCDEDNYADGRFVGALLKPDFNRDLLYMNNYIVHFLMIRADVAREVGPSPDYVEGSQDFDLALRAIERSTRVAHIPRVLYHWRSHPGSTSSNAGSKPYAVEAGRRALEDHFRRRGLGLQVLEGKRPFSYVEEYPCAGRPLVSVVVPADAAAPHLDECIGSLLGRATYGEIEVVVVEYGEPAERDESDARQPASWPDDPRARVVRAEGRLGLAAAVNFGVRESSGEYVLVFGNDVKVATADLVERLVGHLARSEVGVVGAKLLAPDGTVEHAGVSLLPAGGPRSFYAGVPDGDPGYVNRAVLSQDVLAVSGACQMFARDVFEEVGGYDERFEAAYADLDFCLRVHEAGRLVVYDAFSKLHRCSFSSGRAEELFGAAGPARARTRADLERLHRKWPAYVGGSDPYGNPALDAESVYGGLG